MIATAPQYIIDTGGNRVSVILPIHYYEDMVERLDDIEDVRLFDEAKSEDADEPILFSNYLKNRKKNA